MDCPRGGGREGARGAKKETGNPFYSRSVCQVWSFINFSVKWYYISSPVKNKIADVNCERNTFVAIRGIRCSWASIITYTKLKHATEAETWVARDMPAPVDALGLSVFETFHSTKKVHLWISVIQLAICILLITPTCAQKLRTLSLTEGATDKLLQINSKQKHFLVLPAHDTRKTLNSIICSCVMDYAEACNYKHEV